MHHSLTHSTEPTPAHFVPRSSPGSRCGDFHLAHEEEEAGLRVVSAERRARDPKISSPRLPFNLLKLVFSDEIFFSSKVVRAAQCVKWRGAEGLARTGFETCSPALRHSFVELCFLGLGDECWDHCLQTPFKSTLPGNE